MDSRDSNPVRDKTVVKQNLNGTFKSHLEILLFFFFLNLNEV